MKIFVPEGKFTVSRSKFFKFFSSVEPSLCHCNGSISKPPFRGFLWMVSGDSPLPIQGR